MHGCHRLLQGHPMCTTCCTLLGCATAHHTTHPCEVECNGQVDAVHPVALGQGVSQQVVEPTPAGSSRKPCVSVRSVCAPLGTWHDPLTAPPPNTQWDIRNVHTYCLAAIPGAAACHEHELSHSTLGAVTTFCRQNRLPGGASLQQLLQGCLVVQLSTVAMCQVLRAYLNCSVSSSTVRYTRASLPFCV